jgi:hypothetical protein
VELAQLVAARVPDSYLEVPAPDSPCFLHEARDGPGDASGDQAAEQDADRGDDRRADQDLLGPFLVAVPEEGRHLAVQFPGAGLDPVGRKPDDQRPEDPLLQADGRDHLQVFPALPALPEMNGIGGTSGVTGEDLAEASAVGAPAPHQAVFRIHYVHVADALLLWIARAFTTWSR